MAAAPDRTARVHVGADRGNPAVHVTQISGNGDLVHRIGDGAVLDPESAGAAGVIAGDTIDALAHQFGHV